MVSTDVLQHMTLVWMNCEEAPHVHVLRERDRVDHSGAADREFLRPRPVNKLVLESRPAVPTVKRHESVTLSEVTCCQGRLHQLHVACRKARVRRTLSILRCRPKFHFLLLDPAIQSHL
jgi:hypothetical protein